MPMNLPGARDRLHLEQEERAIAINHSICSKENRDEGNQSEGRLGLIDDARTQ